MDEDCELLLIELSGKLEFSFEHFRWCLWMKLRENIEFLGCCQEQIFYWKTQISQLETRKWKLKRFFNMSEWFSVYSPFFLVSLKVFRSFFFDKCVWEDSNGASLEWLKHCFGSFIRKVLLEREQETVKAQWTILRKLWTSRNLIEPSLIKGSPLFPDFLWPSNTCNISASMLSSPHQFKVTPTRRLPQASLYLPLHLPSLKLDWNLPKTREKTLTAQ
jgi:hypothetical protein